MMKNKFLYWCLIITFTILYGFTAFVSTMHAIDFFNMSNKIDLATIIAIVFEVGQMAVLFAILTTENRNRLLAWALMFLLTAVQVTGNVYASFKYMDTLGGTDWTYWQRSILFFVDAETPEMYKIIISWISGALLPIIALGMTALVADNIQLMRSKLKKSEENALHQKITNKIIKDDILDESIKEEIIQQTEDTSNIKEINEEIKEEIIQQTEDTSNIKEPIKEIKPDIKKKKKVKSNKTIEPVNKSRGWHLKKEFIDNDGNIFNKGTFVKKIDKPKENIELKKA